MKKYFILILIALYASNFYSQNNVHFCNGKDSNAFTKILPNKKFLETSLLKYAKVNPLFIVKYTGFPEEAKVAFNYALDVWESIINSPVQIHIEATWYDGEPGVLGAAVPAEYRCASSGNPDHLPDLYSYYAIALAEKMAGKDLNNTSAPDITVKMSKNISWYFGTDANCPAGKYDFVTVVIHEICHAIAINGSIKVENSKGTWGSKGFSDRILPLIFDKYVVNATEQKLIDTAIFDIPSIDLYNQIIGNNLFFNSPIAKKFNGNNTIKLYAPVAYDAGGSILHLDETTFPAGNLNSLMTPFLSMAEANHDPGPIIMGIMTQIGWTHTYITPDPLKDIEATNADITIKALFDSDSGFYSNSKRIVYSDDNFVTPHTLFMAKSGSKDTCFIPAPNKVCDIRFYFAVIDSFGRIYRLPVDSTASPYVIHCGPDLVKPVVAHDSVTFIYSDVTSLQFNATVTDNIAVDSVILEYYINTTKKTDIDFVYDTLDNYTAAITFSGGDIAVGDSIRYRILAIDKSSNSNKIYLPASGYFTIDVEKRPPVVITYKNSFDTATTGFILNGFKIETPSGFSSGALNSPHPYTATGKPQVYKEFTAQLKNRIKILAQESFLAFDEIVLVEPNVEGKVFGEFGFYDYVIVEGSLDNVTWYAFENTGYNSRYVNEWYSAYNSAVNTDGNSTASATPSLYRKHLINLRNNKVFRAGDTVNIRFRLHSDAYFTGWGWAIDNLVIQDSNFVGIENPLLLSALIYPNPANTFINIDIPGCDGDEMEIRIIDITGRVVLDQKAQNMPMVVSTADLPEGLYLISVSSFGGGEIITSKIIIQH